MQESSPIRLIKPSISQLEIEAVGRVLESGMLVSGPVVEEFEKRLANYLDVPHAVCVSSGTAALHLSLLVADIKPGDEVIVPALTFPATANAVEMTGAVPVFADCKPGDVNIDVEKIGKSFTSRTKAIMPVHAFGIPADMNEIMSWARKRNLIVIEDAACALGSKYNDRYCGSFGDLAAFSFHPGKILTTGEGGAVVGYDSISAAKIRSLRNHGWIDGDYRYLGYNYRMTDFQAAIGLGQLEYYGRRLSKRRFLARRYWKKLEELEWIEPVKPESIDDWNVQTLLVKVADRIDRDDIMNFLHSNGIETSLGTYCVPLTRYYRLKYGYSADEFPQAIDLFKRTLSLPLFNDLSEAQIDFICDSLNSYTSKLKMISV